MTEADHSNHIELIPPTPLVEVSEVIPGDAISFRLAPGQRVELSLSAEGIVRLSFSGPDSLPPLPEPPAPASAEPARSIPPAPEQGSHRTTERQPRETFRGIVSTHPRLEATPKGVPKTVFRLATHPDEDTTTHLSCVAFDNQRRKLAQQVYEKVRKGDAVEVIGYKQQRQFKGRNSAPRTVNEVYVAAVRHARETS
jgi:hypothetical protein